MAKSLLRPLWGGMLVIPKRFALPQWSRLNLGNFEYERKSVLVYLCKANCHSWPLKGNPKIEREKREKAERDSQKERIKDFDLTYDKLALAEVRNNTAEVDIAPIYKKRPLAQDHLIGDPLKPRYLWKEFAEKNQKNGFPDNPEEASADLYTYLLQKDVFKRMQKIEIPKFCVGSTVAVTRADPYAPKGSTRFFGLCIYKSPMDNHPGASFVLRNVIDGEPLEIRFHTFSPLIQKIEILKHETRGFPHLKYLRDLPPEESYIKESTKPVPYTEEPVMHVPKPDTARKRNAYRKLFFARRNRKYRDKHIQKQDPYPYKKNKDEFLQQ